jgi:hypothetical protein
MNRADTIEDILSANGITLEQVEALRIEAVAAGDYDTLEDCKAVLEAIADGLPTSDLSRDTIPRIAEVIRDAANA